LKITSFYNLIINFDDSPEKFDEIKNLLEQHPEFINFTGKNMPLLHYACIAENPKIVKLLLEMGADPNQEFEDKTPLKIAYESNQDDLCCLLIENKADPNIKINRNPILFYAYKDNKMDIFEALLKNGANHSSNAIETVYKDRKEDAFKLLLKNGADHKIKCKILLDSFFKYVEDGSDEYFKRISQSILENEDCKDLIFDGCSLIFFAIEYQKNDMLEILLQNNFDPNKISADGFNSPLHFALQLLNLKACEILLQYGADPNLKTLHGANSTKSVNDCLDTFFLAELRYQHQTLQNFPSCGQEDETIDSTEIETEIETESDTENSKLVLFAKELNLLLFKSKITPNLREKINRFGIEGNDSDLLGITNSNSENDEYSSYHPKKKPKFDPSKGLEITSNLTEKMNGLEIVEDDSSSNNPPKTHPQTPKLQGGANTTQKKNSL